MARRIFLLFDGEIPIKTFPSKKIKKITAKVAEWYLFCIFAFTNPFNHIKKDKSKDENCL